jgi:formamidopyrimidine-DNA glycosylase
MTPALFFQQMGKSRRAIKVALLDQKLVAGIGNLYAAEILLLAGIHPEQTCLQLTDRDWQNISRATRRVLRQAIRYEGSTLGDGTYRNALNKKGRYQNHHRVYGREGETCRHCRVGRVKRIVQSQRATFYCPTCQPA